MRRAGRGRLRGRGVGGLRGHADGDRQPRADRHLRRLLGGDPVRHAAARRRLRGLQPVAGGRRAAPRWVYGRARRGGEPPAPMAYPAWLGRWPAALGILAFAWVELVYVNKDDPSQLATMALLYAAVQLVGMSLYGIDAWSRNADAFGVYFRLFSMLSPLHWRARTLYVRPPLAGAPEARCRAGHGRAAVHDDRHRQLRRPLAGRDLDGPGRDRPAPAAALHQPRLQRRDGARDHLHDRPADDGGPHQRPLSPGRARHALDRGRRRHRAVTALRALADPDRPGLRRGALLLAADLPGPGDGLPHLRSPRPRVEPVRHRDDDDQLQPRRRQRRLVRAGLRARARPRGRPDARARPRARRLRTTRATRPARSTGCLRSWSPSPASGSGSCPPPRNDRARRWPTPATGTTRCSTWRRCSSWSSCCGSRSAASAAATRRPGDDDAPG